MTPKNRTELIELMARTLAGKGAWHWQERHDDHDAGSIDDLRADDRYVVTNILTALESSGVALVPVEATEYMALCGEDAIDDAFIGCTSPPDTWEDEASGCYKAMLKAAPYRE